MQEAIPHRSRSRSNSTYESCNVLTLRPTTESGENLKTLVKENAVIVFARKGCCMSYVVRHLLHLLGANPAVYELRNDDDHINLLGELFDCADAGDVQFPAVFIGGRWFGGLDRIIASHIAEELAPALKRAGALWL